MGVEINQVNKMLAYSFVSEVIKNKKIKKRKFSSGAYDESAKEFEAAEIDSANMNFGDLEAYYKNVLGVIENTPEIRQSLVDALKQYQDKGGDLNELYPTDLIVQDESLRRTVFLD